MSAEDELNDQRRHVSELERVLDAQGLTRTVLEERLDMERDILHDAEKEAAREAAQERLPWADSINRIVMAEYLKWSKFIELTIAKCMILDDEASGAFEIHEHMLRRNQFEDGDILTMHIVRCETKERAATITRKTAYGGEGIRYEMSARHFPKGYSHGV